MDGPYRDQGVWEGHEACPRVLSLTSAALAGAQVGGEQGAQRVSSQAEAPLGRVGRLQVQAIVNEFKASTLTIGWRAQEISETLLVRISGKRVYRDLEFEEDQREHRAAVLQKLQHLHQDVVAIMTNSYEVFKNDSLEVRLLGPRSVAS